ncbi:MAG TPA: Calx-beta domain-containing protein [Pyrinomonadaceae bacterium]|jgi:TolB protein|nr:Calx-beta domain-containing protein [Pyrinomonadaceae bacterium]
MSPHNLFIKRLPFFALALCACAVLLTGFAVHRAAAQQGATTPTLKPNGKIAYSGGTLNTINPDGSGETRIKGAPTLIHSPAWSPDGSRLVYNRTYFPLPSSNLYIVNSDGTNAVSLTEAELMTPDVIVNADADWSPDGSRLVYVSIRDGNSDIWVMNADGTNLVNLTPSTPFPDYAPAWSPDGSHIAFTSQRDFPNLTGDTSGGQEIYVMRSDGSNVTRLTNNNVLDMQPAWSPLGDKLAFTRRVANPLTGEVNDDIFTMNANGTGPTNITSHPSFDLEPCWSPDGTKIAFVTYRDAVQNNNSEIYTMDADGSFPTRVTNSSFEDREPDWGTISPPVTPTPTPPPPTPTPTPYTISGRVTDGAGNGLAGVNVILSGEFYGTRSALTAADGSYRHFYFPDGHITISPARDNTIFTPPNVTYSAPRFQLVTGDHTNLDFTAASLPNASTFQFHAPAYVTPERAGVTITVTRSGSLDTGGAFVSYRTVDDPAAVRCDVAGTTAYARCDYATAAGTLYFAAGETEKQFDVMITDDAYVENTESFPVEIFNPAGATLGARTTASVEISANDEPGIPNPIDFSLFFVRQHYLDFLTREPEMFEPWSPVLNNCSNVYDNPACDRITVSSSFFRAPESGFKGYFVYRFYALSYGRMPRYNEIIPDMTSLSGASAEEVFANRAAFAERWLARQEFRNLYDAKTNAGFVGTLMDRYGLARITTPAPANPEGASKVMLTRADLIGGLDNQTLTRAQVVRAIVESDEVFAAEFNPAFVAMQYFGYLRRDPDPDYNKWLAYLKANPTDFRTMVRGFVNSVEYRLRFGQP